MTRASVCQLLSRSVRLPWQQKYHCFVRLFPSWVPLKLTDFQKYSAVIENTSTSLSGSCVPCLVNQTVHIHPNINNLLPDVAVLSSTPLSF